MCPTSFLFADFLSCAHDTKQNPDEVTKFSHPAGDIQEKIRKPDPLPAILRGVLRRQFVQDVRHNFLQIEHFRNLIPCILPEYDVVIDGIKIGM